MTEMEYVYYRIIPTFVGVLILAAAGFLLDISIRRQERRQREGKPPPQGA